MNHFGLATSVTVIIILFSCNRAKKTELSLDRYAEFRSQCLILLEAYEEDSQGLQKVLANTMAEFKIDSAELDRFFKTYEQNPTEWLEVETAVQRKLEERLKRRNTDG